MAQLFQFKSATIPSIEYAGSDYLYIITNIAWTTIDIDTIDFAQLLDIVGKVNNGDLYALRRTRLFDALDVKLGTDVSGNYAPSVNGKIEEWDKNTETYSTEDNVQIRKISVKESKRSNLIEYDPLNKDLKFDFSDMKGNTGFVCITNVQPVNGLENVNKSQTSSDGIVLDGIITSTENVIVHILAISGSISLMPEWVTIDGQTATLQRHTTENLWIGSVQLSSLGSVITAEHSEGSVHECSVTIQAKPIVQSVEFTGTYPALGQTHYHYDEAVGIEITANSPIYEVQIVSPISAVQADLLTPGNNDFVIGTTVNITAKTESTDNGPENASVWVRVKDSLGAWSNPFNSNATNQNTDHVSVIGIDSDTPNISINSIDYPDGQGAVKVDEQAEVLYSYAHTEELVVTSIGNDLNILTPAPSLNSQILVERNSSSPTQYNISSNNFRITANKITNNTTSHVNGCVFIANEAPQITITGAHTISRLRSSPEGQPYALTVVSNQRLLNIPTLTAGVGGGSLGGSFTAVNSGNGQNFTGRTIIVLDSANRGTYQFAISNVNGLAGLSTTTITSGEDYTIGGFVARTGYFTIGNAYSDIGVNVSGFNNAAKLVVTVLSLPGTYVENTIDVNYSSGNHIFTIVSTGSPTVFNPAGNAIRLNEPNVIGSISTSPGMPYTIEELA